MLGGRLEKIRIEDRQQLEEMRKVVVTSNEALRADLLEKAVTANNELVHSELAELRILVKELHRLAYVNRND